MSEGVLRADVMDHLVQFYDHDSQLVEWVGAYLAAAVLRGDAAIVVATRAHINALSASLAASGVDVASARGSGQYIALDAAVVIEACLVNGFPDPGRFDTVIGGLVRRAQAAGREICVFGEMVSLLWASGQLTAAVELERLWNRLGEATSFSLLCGYSRQLMGGPDLLAEFDQVCHLHSAIIASSAGDVGYGPVAGVSRTFRLSNEAPRAARHFVLDALTDWGADYLRDDAALVVSELTTNAVVHARSEFRVVVSATPSAVRISVADNSSVAPGCQDFTLGDSSGRGLGIVSAVSSKWGTACLEDGKVVWAELRR